MHIGLPRPGLCPFVVAFQSLAISCRFAGSGQTGGPPCVQKAAFGAQKNAICVLVTAKSAGNIISTLGGVAAIRSLHLDRLAGKHDPLDSASNPCFLDTQGT